MRTRRIYKLEEKHKFENCIYSVKLKEDTFAIPVFAVGSCIRDIVLPGSAR